MKTENQRYGLILSENITSTMSVPSIIKANPFDSSFIADKLKLIYNWEPSKSKYEKDYNFIKNQSVLKWVSNFISDIKRIRHNDSTNKVKVGLGLNMGIMKLNDSFSPLSSSRVSKYYCRTQNRIFFLDYENTLQEIDETICDETTSITNSPSKKNILSPRSALLKVLDNLSQDENNLIFIMSKYETDFLTNFFSKVPNLGLCGENGFYYKYPKEKTYNQIVDIQDWSWRDTVIKILKEFTDKTEGSFYIEKKSCVIWNYKLSDSDFGPIQSDEIKTHLMSIFSNKLDIENYNGTLEIKPKDVNKGAFVAKIIQEEFKKRNIDLIVAFGDDNTDEEMFSYFNSAEKYFPNFNNKIKVLTATIGKKPSKAKYFISDVNDCIGILDSVTHTNFSNKFERRAHVSKTDNFTPQLHLFSLRQNIKRSTLKDEDELKNLNTPRLFEDDDE
jgi:trehalose 6-phosphate synthase/phosphatase